MTQDARKKCNVSNNDYATAYLDRCHRWKLSRTNSFRISIGMSPFKSAAYSAKYYILKQCNDEICGAIRQDANTLVCRKFSKMSEKGEWASDGLSGNSKRLVQASRYCLLCHILATTCLYLIACIIPVNSSNCFQESGAAHCDRNAYIYLMTQFPEYNANNILIDIGDTALCIVHS